MGTLLSTPLTWLSLAWLAWGIWRGCKRGFAKVAAGLLGLLAAYIVVIIWLWPFARFLEGHVSGAWVWPLASSILFIGTASVVSLAFRLLTKNYAPGPLNAVMGGVGNGIFASVILAVLLWALSLVVALQPQHAIAQGLAKLGVSQSHPFVQTSQNFIASAAGIGMRLMRFEPEKIQASQKLLAAPTQSLQNIQAVTGSEETKKLLQNPDIREAVRSGDSDAVMSHPAFAAFSAQPGMQQMRELVPVAPDQTQDEALAQTFTRVLQKIDSIQQTPEIQAALSDPEVRELLNTGNTARLLTHPKTQPIVSVIMAELAKPPGATASEASSQTIDEPAQLTDLPVFEKVDDSPMYKWVDERGRVNFSTWDKIPANHRENAELLLPGL